MKVKAPFAGHPAASSAWLPAAIPSLLGGLESHCNKEMQWHLSTTITEFLQKTNKWKSSTRWTSSLPQHLPSSHRASIVPAAFNETCNTQRSIYSNCYRWHADPFWASTVIPWCISSGRSYTYCDAEWSTKLSPGDVKSLTMTLKERTRHCENDLVLYF